MTTEHNSFPSPDVRIGKSFPIKPPSFAERLRNESLNIIKDFGAFSFRVAAYISSGFLTGIGLESIGVNHEIATLTAVGVLCSSAMIGESVGGMNKLARSFPWLATNRSGWWDRKRT